MCPKLFDILSFKRWRLTPLLLSMGWTEQPASKKNTAEVTVYGFQVCVIKGIATSSLLVPSDGSLLGKSVAMCEDTRAALWGCPCGEELSLFSNSRSGAEPSCQLPCEWAILEINPPAPVKPPRGCSPSWHPDWKLRRHLGPPPSSQASPGSLTRGND